MTSRQTGKIKYGYIEEKCDTCGSNYTRKIELEKKCSCGKTIKREDGWRWNEIQESCNDCLSEDATTTRESRVRYCNDAI